MISPFPETPSHEPVNKAEPAKRSYRGRWSVETKLAHVLDAINETTLADFLYFTFRVKDEKTDDGVVHDPYSQISPFFHFLIPYKC